jgi:hypothetical protein
MARVRSFRWPPSVSAEVRSAYAAAAVLCRWARASPAARRAVATQLVHARRIKPAQRAAAVVELATAISEAVALQRAPGGGIYRQIIAVPTPRG